MNLRTLYQSEIKAFTKVCHRLARSLYVTGYGGNLAWKVDEDCVIITPTQRNKGDVKKRDVVFVNLQGGVLEGDRKPTGELPMYLKFFNERPDIVSVVHCHPPHVCALAISTGANWLERPLYPETTTEIGPVPIVPYAQPLTEELADQFSPYLARYNSFIMENHGLVTLSRGDIDHHECRAAGIHRTVGLLGALQRSQHQGVESRPGGAIRCGDGSAQSPSLRRTRRECLARRTLLRRRRDIRGIGSNQA